MIESLLDIAKIETGQLALEKTAVSIAPLRHQPHPAQNQRKSHTLTSNHETFEHITLLADKTRLQQIILNLLDNAVKYTPNGGHIQLKLGLDVKNNQLTIKVQDSGVGISARDQERIFQPFIQLNKSRSHPLEGAGLGLALVHWLVTFHNGAICVESKQNEGSRFTVSLPWSPISDRI